MIISYIVFICGYFPPCCFCCNKFHYVIVLDAYLGDTNGCAKSKRTIQATVCVVVADCFCKKKKRQNKFKIFLE